MDAKLNRPRGLACLECGTPLAVRRTDPGDGYILRRRACAKCGRRFTTKERFVNAVDDAPADMVGVVSFSIARALEAAGFLAPQPLVDRPGPLQSPLKDRDNGP